MILVFGSLNIDLVVHVPVIPGPGRTVLAPSYRTHFGGKGANQAVAAARIAGAGRVLMAGRIGRDGFDDGAIENLRANGVDTDLVVRSDQPTGCAFITVDQGGENAITVASGANMTASADDLPTALFNRDTMLVLQMEVPFAQALAAARRTVLGSGTVIWNLAPVPENMTGAMMNELLTVTNYLLVNEHEAVDAAAAIGHDPPDYAAAATDLAKAGGLTCIVTAGAKGALAVSADGAPLCAHDPRIAPVDTTGAGDTFVGAFTAMLHEKVALQSALEIGCEAAAQNCLRPGAQDGMPVRGAIKSIA
ncbi:MULTISPECIES: ribokinase [unclassified Bradyrhizobium]|uniref:ribokinase n=1 Tax=unclassified Bradyrhizobium TaxID=2631580 RepID=UPI001FF8B1D0|nr:MULTISPECIES: ribokinase [unclassified Bradyrhizobium]MCK1497796.1 ribokinase [Bradyrhizobium sp. 188]UPJ80768.1 ribokinase [Bradyrhizobium sp. 184]UPJ88561.1 ribokinase [Bradyrhizobium sp. 183]